MEGNPICKNESLGILLPEGRMTMEVPQVEVPVSLLQDPAMEASGKLVWMLLQHKATNSPAVLQQLSGLSRPTIRKWLAKFATAPPPAPPGAADRVMVPVALLSDRRVGAYARVLYGLLQTAPCPSSYKALRELGRANLRTVRRAVRELADAGWLQVEQANQQAPLTLKIGNPELDRLRAKQARELAQRARARTERQRAAARIKDAQHKCEALMREYLSLLVDSQQFEDDAAPGFLINPLTGQTLELDRYYPPNVAFEYNGPQHYGPTEKYPDEEAARKQQVRDLIKEGICKRQGITLVLVHREDLTLEGMRAKVGQLLPLRDVTGAEPLVRLLRQKGEQYRT